MTFLKTSKDRNSSLENTWIKTGLHEESVCDKYGSSHTGTCQSPSLNIQHELCQLSAQECFDLALLKMSKYTFCTTIFIQLWQFNCEETECETLKIKHYYNH